MAGIKLRTNTMKLRMKNAKSGEVKMVWERRSDWEGFFMFENENQIQKCPHCAYGGTFIFFYLFPFPV